ncbi:hypothetical protein KR093_007528, partial [Drosophila rubida]
RSGKSLAVYEAERQLIQLVSEQPALYNSRHARFKDDAYKELLWQLIGNKLGKEPSKCMSTWAELRHRYQRHVLRLRQQQQRRRRRRRRPCPSQGQAGCVMLHEEQLLFLYPFVARQPLQHMTNACNKADKKRKHIDDDDDDDEVTIVAPQPVIIDVEDIDSYDEYKLNAEQLLLIDAVRAYPQLYDVRHSSYPNHRHRGLIWGAISNELHEKATKLMKTWLQLQMRYEWELNFYKDGENSRLRQLLQFLEPHVRAQQGSVCKLSVYLRSAWHDPIEHFRSVLNLIQVLKTLPELTQMVDDYQHSQQKPQRYHEFWLRVASQLNASHQRCEVSWLVLRQFYRDLTEMRKVGYQLQDKWFFENIIASLYTQQGTRQARRGRKRSASINASASPPVHKWLAASEELAQLDDGPKGLALGEQAPPLPLAIVYPLSSKAAASENTNSNGSSEGSSSSSSSSSSNSSSSSTATFVLPRIDAAISVVPIKPATEAAAIAAPAVAVPAPTTSTITVVPNSSLYPPGSEKATSSSSSSSSNVSASANAGVSTANELGIVAHVVKKSSKPKLIPILPKPLTVRNDKVPMPSKFRPATATTTAATAAETAAATLTTKSSATIAGTSISIAPVPRNIAEHNGNTNTNTNTNSSPNKLISSNAVSTDISNSSITLRSAGSSNNSLAIRAADKCAFPLPGTVNIRALGSTISIRTSHVDNLACLRAMRESVLPSAITGNTSSSSSSSSSSNSNSSSNSSCNSNPKACSSPALSVETPPAEQALRVEFRDCPSTGRMLHVTGHGVPPQANFNMSRTAVFIREVLAIPQLHSKEPQLFGRIDDLWLQLSKKLHLPDFVCRGIWAFLSHNINLFPQIAPMVDLMRPFKSTLKVWEKSHRLFSKFDEIARKYQWMLHKHELPALMQHFKRYEHLYWELRRPRPGETLATMRPPRQFTEQERIDVWREAKENFPHMNHRDVWSMFKFAFKTYMEDLERGIENPWPQNWWHALEQLKFLVNVRYHPLDPYYYIVHNKFMEEVKRCSMYEALMQPDDDEADSRRQAKPKLPQVEAVVEPMPWETEEAKRLLVGDLSQAVNVEPAQLQPEEPDSETESLHENAPEALQVEQQQEDELEEEPSSFIESDDEQLATKSMEDYMLKSELPVAELAQFIGNDERQLPSIDGFQLTAVMRRHSSAYSVSSTAEKRAAWLRISKELKSPVNECRLSLQHMLREQRLWRISDPSGRCNMSAKYFRHMTEIYREVKFSYNARHGAHNPGDVEDSVFPERYIPEINTVTCQPSLVVKNWAYAAGHFPLVIQEELRTRLRFIFAKYERLGNMRCP